MNYEQRMSKITSWFKSEIAIRFNMPRDIDPKIAAMDVIESMNSNIPNNMTDERMGNLLALTAKEISRSANSRTLPTVKMFVDAARLASKSHGAPHSAPVDKLHDPLLTNANRILSGEPVADQYLRGKLREQLLSETEVTEEDLKPYDLYIAAHKQYQ